MKWKEFKKCGFCGSKKVFLHSVNGKKAIYMCSNCKYLNITNIKMSLFEMFLKAIKKTRRRKNGIL